MQVVGVWSKASSASATTVYIVNLKLTLTLAERETAV